MDSAAEAREAALAALARRALTVAELRARLLRKKFPRPVVEACLARLAAAGLVDDQSVAYNFARGCAEMGRRGPSRVRATLLARGVPAAIADAAIAEAFPPAARDAALLRALQRLAGRGGVPQDRRGRERLIRQLRRLGFPLSRVLAALQRAGTSPDEWPEMGEDDDAVE